MMNRIFETPVGIVRSRLANMKKLTAYPIECIRRILDVSGNTTAFTEPVRVHPLWHNHGSFYVYRPTAQFKLRGGAEADIESVRMLWWCVMFRCEGKAIFGFVQ